MTALTPSPFRPSDAADHRQAGLLPPVSTPAPSAGSLSVPAYVPSARMIVAQFLAAAIVFNLIMIIAKVTQ